MIKAYFYRNGRELKDHPLNGITLGAQGPFINRNGDRAEICQIHTNTPITVADFGGEPVVVKAWWPGIDGKGHSESFTIRATDCETCGKRGYINCPDHK